MLTKIVALPTEPVEDNKNKDLSQKWAKNHTTENQGLTDSTGPLFRGPQPSTNQTTETAKKQAIEQLLFEGGVNLYRREHGTWPDLPTTCALTPYWSRSTVYRRLKAYRLYCDRDPHGGFWMTPPPPDVPHPADVDRIRRLEEVASWTAGPETEPVKLAETGQPKRETGTGRAETERLTV